MLGLYYNTDGTSTLSGATTAAGTRVKVMLAPTANCQVGSMSTFPLKEDFKEVCRVVKGGGKPLCLVEILNKDAEEFEKLAKEAGKEIKVKTKVGLRFVYLFRL